MKLPGLMFLCFLIVMSFSIKSWSQVTERIENDTLTVENQDTSAVIKQVKVEEDSVVMKYNTLTPKRVSMYAALIPGMGQYKNRQYWKMPIVYVGLGVATYFVIDNRKEYNFYRSIYAGRLSNDPEAFQKMPEYNMETIRRARDFYRKNMEMSVIFGVLGYGVQIIDALIFAHLKDYDISDDLSLRLQSPQMNPQAIGFAVALKF